MIFTYVNYSQTQHWQHVKDSMDRDSTRTVERYANAYIPTVIITKSEDNYDYHVVLKRTILYRDVYMP